jgi:4'-phosphopantetheinyl transferase EntD
MFQTLVPTCAAVVTSDDLPVATPVLAGEASLVARASSARKQEFANGRACARAALGLLGRPGFAVLAGPAREPRWPAGIVGSITHCPGYCAAVVAPSHLLAGLGIDVARNVALPRGLDLRVAHPGELTTSGPAPAAGLATLIFSAKEASYKAWYPLTHLALDFLDVTVGLDLRRGTFEVHPIAPGAVALAEGCTIRGRWAATAAHIFTVATIVTAPSAA